MEGTIDFTYDFLFSHQNAKQFNIKLNPGTLKLIPIERVQEQPWTKLDYNKCSVCSLSEKDHPNCPVAQNMAHIVEEFKDYFSYESVKVSVTTKERVYSKTTSLQEGLSSLIGIIMVTSGCPVMERLKPVVRFHLPFATLEETIYRMVSMYLMAQVFIKQAGRLADWELKGLKKIYADVSQVNRDFAERLSDAARRDANLNALVNLDCFATMIPMTTESVLDEIKGYFNQYLG